MISWCNENQGFLNALLVLGTIAISIIALYVSQQGNKRDYLLNIFKIKQELYDSFNYLDELVNELKCLEDNLNEMLDDHDEGGVESLGLSIEEFYYEKVKPHEATLKKVFNNCDYLLLEQASKLDEKLKDDFYQWIKAFNKVCEIVSEDEVHIEEGKSKVDSLLDAIQKLFDILPKLTSNLDAANKWLKQDLRKSIPKMGILK